MIYRFYLTIGSTVTEVFPLNFLETALVDELESNKVFRRRKFSGALTFVNNNGDDDFTLLNDIHQADPCVKIIISIERSSVAYWAGFFSTTDGKFDQDRCTFTVNPLPDDEYEDFLDNMDIKYNILALAAKTTRLLQGPQDITYTRNRFIYNNSLAPSITDNVLEYLAEQVLPGVSISSTFFSNANNPVTLHANHLKYLMIAQKSDIIRPSATYGAEEAMLSWNDLMDILWAMFQVTWDYDLATDTINVEHISFWEPTAGLNLTSQAISKAGNKYSYIKEEMPKYEKFFFMEAFETNFIGTPIWYDSKCVDQNSDSNIRETKIDVTTDLDYIIRTPEEIADEGFVIICNRLSSGLYYVELEGGALDAQSRVNMHLSWANLQDRYFRHNRVLIQGYMNNVLTTFWTGLKTILQDCYAIVCSSDNYDPDKYITTELGETYLDGAKASVRRSELKPSGEMKFSLVYGPTSNAPTEIVDEKWMYLEESGICGHFYLTLSEPAPAGMEVTASHEVLDSTGTFVCAGGPETFAITAGVMTADFAFAFCGGGIPAGGCANFAWDFTAEPTWHQTIVYLSNCTC